jgi:hypothetical protein
MDRKKAEATEPLRLRFTEISAPVVRQKRRLQGVNLVANDLTS